MGPATSALNSGRNALLSYQGALHVIGNNVANAGNADYSRQSAQLNAASGPSIGPGLRPGAGVMLSGIKRHVDEALENRLRASVGDLRSATAEREALARVEVYFDDLSGAGISDSLIALFNSFSDVQNAPEDRAIRSVAVAAADALASSIRSARKDLLALAGSINDDVAAAASDADRIAREIADLNRYIVAAEAGGRGQDGALRDRRDALIRDLSESFDVVVREQPDGSINVYVGSEPLVQYAASRGLSVIDESDGEFVRTRVQFTDNNSPVDVGGGAIEGLIKTRDRHVVDQISALDRLAAGIIAEINGVHADGQGLTPFTAVVSASAVDDPAAPLDDPAAGLAIPPTDGSFFIAVADDATGTPTAYRIDVDLDGEGAGASLDDVVTAINDQVIGVTAAVTADRRLSLTADAGFSFTFGHDGAQFREDSANFLQALGINTLFEGSSAADIAVRQEIVSDAGRLAAATLNRVGDGINAGRLAGLIDSPSASLNNATILDFYNSMANSVAAAGARARDAVEAADAVHSALLAQRESVSGVSLDEEAIELLKYERAFQGAARFVGTVDRLMQEMLALVT